MKNHDSDRNPALWASFGYAVQGVLFALRSQRNFRIHLAATLMVVAVGLWVDLSSGSWALVTLTIGGVLVLEMLNTALEVFVDMVEPRYHPLAKQIKDLMAGAVLVTAVVAVVVGLLVLGPALLNKLG